VSRLVALTFMLAAGGCSRQPALNYRHCLRLRVGMTREQVFAVMGPPEDSFPYVEGKTLPHLKGRTSYEWSTPASMPAANIVSVDEASGKAASIRCGDSVLTTTVYIEPPAPAVSTAPPAHYGVDPSPAPAPRAAPKDHGPGNASGRPLSE
jgi:hypothetical protein